MSNIEEFLNNLENQKGFKGWLKRLLYRGLPAGFKAADSDISKVKSDAENISAELKKTEDSARVSEAHSLAAEEKAAALEAECKALRAELESLKSSLAGKNGGVAENLENVSINVRNNNSIIESLRSDMELVKVKLNGIKRDMSRLSENTGSAAASAPSAAEVVHTAEKSEKANESSYEAIDYFDFENHFRGSIESIKNAQKFYLKYFKDKSHVLDIGCGRGEFLSLLQENGIEAEGADIYQPYVDYCQMKGLKAACSDGTDYLASLDKVDGIFVGQVVEHLQPEQIIRMCNTAYEKLPEGGCIIVETPNPTSLSVYTNAFYIDPSHVKPVHPLTMKYYLEKAGFRSIEIIYTESSRPPYSIPELKCSSAENADEFNAAMKKVSDMMFGSQDYAVAAVK